MNKNKVVLDFTQINSPEQDVAMMPANLAKKLLRDYSKQLVAASPYDIVEGLINDLKDCYSLSNPKEVVTGAIQRASEFVQERQLINNIVAENWNAYEVVELTTEPLV